MSKINSHFVDQMIYRAGVTEKKATEFFVLLSKALKMKNWSDYLTKVDDIGMNRSIYKFKYGIHDGYCVVDNFKKIPITFMTKIIAKNVAERRHEMKRNAKEIRDKSDFIRHMSM